MKSFDDVVLKPFRVKNIKRRSLPIYLEPRQILFGIDSIQKKPVLPKPIKPTSPKNVSPKLKGTKKNNAGIRDNVFRLSRVTATGKTMAKQCSGYTLTELKDILEKLSGKKLTYTKKIDYCSAIERELTEQGLMSPGASPAKSKTPPKILIKTSPSKKPTSPKSNVSGTFKNKTGIADNVFRIVLGKGTGKDCKAFTIPQLRKILYELTGADKVYKLKAQYCKEIQEALNKEQKIQNTVQLSEEFILDSDDDTNDEEFFAAEALIRKKNFEKYGDPRRK